MMRIATLLVGLLIGIAGGVLLQRPLSELLPGGIDRTDDKDEAPKGAAEARPTRDKKLVVVEPGIAKALGIHTAIAELGTVPTEIRVVGLVGFNEDKLARVVPRVPGTVRQVLKNAGDRVAAGEALAIIDSKDVADAKSTYVAVKDKLTLAETTFARQDELFRKKVSSEQDLIAARRELTQVRSDMRVATQSLLTLGFRDADLKRLEAGAGDLSRYEVVAPFGGEVVEKRIYTGEYLPQDREIFLIADLNTVWVHLQIGPDKLKDVAVGQAVRILTNNGRSAADAKLDYVAPVISEETRAARARVDLENPDRRWRPGTVVEARIEGAAREAAIIVPAEAVQNIDGQDSVFLPVEGGFRVRAVKVGRTNSEAVEILKGLKAGDKVAAGQTFILKAEAEKGALGEDND